MAAAASVLALATVVWWTRGARFSLEPQADQNVLLITIDTLRADALGAYGGRAATPNIDRLAVGGARFTFAHAHAVVTLPSHASILTGRLPYEHGIRDNSGYRLQANSDTLATRLKAAGFATGAFVGGFPLAKRFGLATGFDVYDDQISEMQADAVFTMPERPANVVVSRALEWIGQQRGRFLAWVHLFDPHAPYKPPEEFLARHRDRPYDGEVAWVDHALGPLFERLASLQRPTLVVLTSDHGEGLGDHGEMTHGMFAYEPTLRVPLVVARVESGVRASGGVVVDVPVSHVDILPTVLDLVGVPGPGQMAGRPLRDVIRGGRADERSSYFESMTYNLVRGWAPLRGVLVGREKYIDQPIAELYDLSTDAGEQRNRASTEAERSRLMANILKSFNVAPPGRPGRESTNVIARLRSLGYVSGSAAPKAVYTEADDLKNLVDVDRDLHAASELYQSGRIADAIARLRRVIARRPDAADAYGSLAHAYWETGRPAEAIAILEDALRQGAPDRDIRIRLALYLAESGAGASKALALLEGMPNDVEALNARGVAYGSIGRYDEAIASFERMLKIEPTNALAQQNVASMVLAKALGPATLAPQRSQALRAAEAQARRAIELDPSVAKAHTTLGVILARTDRKAEAIDSWKRAVALDGAEFDALYNLVIVLAQSGREDEARAYARQFVAGAPPAQYGPAIEELRPLARPR